jgi:hypothetical protein
MSNWYREIVNLLEGIGDIRPHIETIEKQYGVSIKYTIDNNVFRLENIDRTTGTKGNGSLALSKLIELTNEYGFNITLTVDKGHPNLVKFYLDHGFVPADHPTDIKAWFNKHQRDWYYADEYEPEDEDDERPELPWVNMIHYAGQGIRSPNTIISEDFNIDDYTSLGLDATKAEPFMKAGFSPKAARMYLEVNATVDDAMRDREFGERRRAKEEAEQKMLANIEKVAKKNTPITYNEACAIIAADDDLFDLVRGWTWNADYAEYDQPEDAARFLAVLKRMKPVKKHLFRGQMPFGDHDSHTRGFHSWSANRQTAEIFAERNGVVLEINRPIQGVALSDVLDLRMKLRPGESHYGGPQAEWFVVDQPEQFKKY